MLGQTPEHRRARTLTDVAEECSPRGLLCLAIVVGTQHSTEKNGRESQAVVHTFNPSIQEQRQAHF